MISKLEDLRKNRKQSFYDYVYGILEISDVPIDFFKYLEHEYGLILFGGSVRDYIVFKGNCEIRDFDFVIVGLENSNSLIEMVNEIFKGFKWDYNQFGGVKISTNGVSLDCWRLEDTYAFRKGKAEVSVEHLLDTPMLNIDRYAYDMNTMQYISHCNKNFPVEIDFHLYDAELLEINLVRAMVYSERYNLRLSSAIKLKIKEALTNETQTKKMRDFQLYHYKEEIINLDRIVQKLGGYDD